MKKNKAFYVALNNLNNQLVLKLMGHYAHIELIKLASLEELIPFIQKGEVDYLVIDANIPAKLLVTHKSSFENVSMNIKILWITPDDNVNEAFDSKLILHFFKNIEFFNADLSLMRKITIIYDFFHADIEFKTNKDELYIPLDIIYLEAIKKSPCDIFLKISEKKFIKIINKDDDYKINEIIEGYLNKNVKFFYITFNNFTKFKDNILRKIFRLSTVSDDKIVHQIRITDSVLSIANNFGISSFVIEGINETFSEIHLDFNSNAKLKGFFDRIGMLNITTIGNHSYLTAIFMALIGKKLLWFNKEIKKNLFMAALLHDLDIIGTGLENYEFKNLIEINTLELKEQDIVKNHALHLSQKLSKIDIIPNDVINIILKHHEGAGVNSYPLGLAAEQLSPPSCLFNTAHQFSLELSNIGFNFDKVAEAITAVRFHFTGHAFNPYIDILEKEVFKIS